MYLNPIRGDIHAPGRRKELRHELVRYNGGLIVVVRNSSVTHLQIIKGTY